MATFVSRPVIMIVETNNARWQHYDTAETGKNYEEHEKLYIILHNNFIGSRRVG